LHSETLTGSQAPRDEAAAGNPHASTAGASVLTALGAFAVYLFAAAPAPYLLDSAELAAASFGLGIAHPPGEPLALLWGKLFTLLPLGSVAFRVSLSQAVAGAVAVGLVHRGALALVAALDDRGDLGPLGRQLLAALAALGFGLAPGVVFCANRPEVYALATALGAGALLAAAAAGLDDARPALLAGLLVGLGLANHPLIAGLGAVAALVGALPLLRSAGGLPRGRLVLGAAGATTTGLLVLVYLPARALALYTPGAPVDTLMWGDGRSAEGLWWIVSARTFVGKNLLVQGNADPAALPFVLLEELGPLAVLGLVGAGLALRAPASRPWAIALATLAGGAMLAALGAGLDPLNPDIRGYLGLGLAALAVFAAAGLAPLLGFLRRSRLATGLATAALALTVGYGLAGAPAVSLRATDAPDAVVNESQAAVAPRGVVATSHFETAFLTSYQRLVEGRRPDADWVHLGFVRGPGYAARLVVARPHLAPLLEAHGAGKLDAPAIRAVGRTVLIEADQHLPPTLRPALYPAGLSWTLQDRNLGLQALPEGAFAEAARDRQVRGYFAWRAYQDALLACAPHPDAAGLRLRELARLVPADARFRALRAACPPPR
jgi:hypothetical protein